MSRQRFLCRDNHQTNSVELCRDILKLCRDIISEKGIEDRRDIIFYVVTKTPLRPVFGDPQFQPQSTTHHLKIYK